MPSKSLIATSAVISAMWLVLVCVLAERFNIPSADGILYSMPLADAKHPFDLGIPYLNDFEGYGSSWGHHWPGSMWIKGLIFTILPYSRVADVAVLSLFQLLAAFTAGGLVWKATGRMIPAVAAWLLVSSDRLLLLACAGNRFEPIAVAIVLLLFAHSVTDFNKHRKNWRRLILLATFLCPTLHPYSLVMGGMILGFEFLAKRSQADRSHSEWGKRVAAFALGCAALALWFLVQPEAWKQFAANMALQKSFYQNWNSVVAGLGNYRLHGGLLLWGAGLASSILFIMGWPSKACREQAPLNRSWRFLAPTLFIAVPVIHTLTRCENFHYLAFGSPFAAMMVCITATKAVEMLPPLTRWVPAAGFSLVLLTHVTIVPFRLLQFVKAGCPDLNAEFSAVLASIPSQGAVFIPHMFWAAAIADAHHEFHWFTFPIASPLRLRKSYENIAYSAARSGDILIVDKSMASGVDRFGLHPTFPLFPPDPEHWTLIGTRKRMFPGSIPWGMDLSIYEYHSQ